MLIRLYIVSVVCIVVFFLMIRRPPRSTRTDTLFPYTTLFRSDGGTRTASISGAWVAMRLAVDKLLAAKTLVEDPIADKVGAISCGIYKGTPVLDLDYDEDSVAEADGNFVLTRSAERRLGKECVSTCRSRWSPVH